MTERATSSADARAGFSHVDTWIFDLDNTLYPHHLNLWQQVDAKIKSYIAGFLNVPPDEAFRLQKHYYKTYGTSMRGLMIEHGMQADDFLDYVHDIDHSPLEPNPVLGQAIAALPGRKLIFTNGTVKHAQSVLARLDFGVDFDAVFDIIAAGMMPKPFPETYDKFLRDHAVDPARAAMVEDLARNLEVPHRLGMRTVLVVPDGSREVFRESWEFEGRDDPHVDVVTDDLARFLATLLPR
jgi:putative hydrolase of the HAD superfamily